MVALGPDGKNRRTNIGERNRSAISFEAALGEVVIEEQFAQVFRMHAVRHAGRIRVPGHQVAHRLALSEQIVVHQARPDKVVRAQHLERASHLPAVEEALFPHHVFEKRQLTLVDHQHDLAGFGEIRLRCQQREGCKPLIAVARHRGGRDRQQRAAQAIGGRVHFAIGQHRVHGSKRAHHPSVR